MKKVLNKILPAILLVTLTTPAFAENRQGAVTVSPFVGGYMLDNKLPFESRPMFGLRAGYNFTKNLGAEAMFGYSLTETRLRLGATGSKETDLYKYGVDILYHFMPDNKLVPFVEIGGGVTHFKIPNTPSMSATYYVGQVNYGAGVKYFVTPDLALRADARHAIIVQDVNGSNLEYAVGLTFQFGGKRKTMVPLEEVADNTAPTVIFSAPVNGASTVALNQKTSVAFSEDMDQESLNTDTFTLQQGATPVSGTVTTIGSTATFAPARDFEKGKPYTATITTGAKDLSGNTLANNYQWQFTTGLVADTVAPTVSFTSPVNGDKTAPVNQNVSAAFSENMDPATLNAATFTVQQGATPVAGRVTASASSVVFTPARNFEKGRSYTATVSKGARDLGGNALGRDYVWNFTAYAAPKVVGVLVTLDNSHFDFDSVAVSENGKTILNHNAVAMKANSNMKIRVAGYTSAAGTPEYNQKLSERRAEAVKEYLVKTGGIDGSRISTIGYGETNPAVHEADPSDKLSPAALANMRVIVEVVED